MFLALKIFESGYYRRGSKEKTKRAFDEKMFTLEK
jgi:hypothetical protein